MQYKGKEYEVNFLQEPRYGERGELSVAYIEIEDGTQLIGVSERSPKDDYNVEQAQKVSAGRLQKKLKQLSKAKFP